jgi:transcriptional regulator with XRE-family HTH domain
MTPKKKGNKMAFKTVPLGACQFREGNLVRFQADEDEGKPAAGPRRFKIKSLSGKPIRGHWFWGNLAIDLAGVRFEEKMPVLREHESEQIVGYTDRQSVDGSELRAEGVFSEKTDAAREVLDLADEGFPWQASVHAVPEVIEEIEAGSFAKVNGERLNGPGTIFRKSQIRETSFCALGADDQTSAAALAAGAEIKVEIRKGETMTGTELGAELGGVISSAIDAAVTDERDRDAIVSELAEAAGIEVAAVESIISGETNCPPVENLEAFAGVLDIDAADMISAGISDGCEYNPAEDEGEPAEENAEPAENAAAGGTTLAADDEDGETAGDPPAPEGEGDGEAGEAEETPEGDPEGAAEGAEAGEGDEDPEAGEGEGAAGQAPEGEAAETSAERTRAAETVRLAVQYGVPGAAAEAIEAGEDREAAEKRFKAARLALLGSEAPESPGPAAGEMPSEDGTEKWAAEFKASAELQREFRTEARFVAFKRAEKSGAARVASRGK